MLKSWLIRQRRLVQWGIPVLFGVVGLLTAVLVYFLEHTNTDNKALIFIVALIFPSAISLVVVTEIVLLWFYDVWLIGIADIKIVPLQDVREFVRLRRDVVRSIKPGTLTRPIFCTSRCNFFARPEGRTGEIQAEIKQINSDFVHHLARISIGTKGAPNNAGGFRLMVQYDNHENAELEVELGKFVDIFLAEATKEELDWNWYHFDVRRLMERSVKDYFVIEDHVFKTIRKTKESNEIQYMYIQSAVIAATYRNWLADLFEYGEGHETEKDEIRHKLADLKREALEQVGSLEPY
jgi:hypothetical protein